MIFGADRPLSSPMRNLSCKRVAVFDCNFGTQFIQHKDSSCCDVYFVLFPLPRGSWSIDDLLLRQTNIYFFSTEPPQFCILVVQCSLGRL